MDTLKNLWTRKPHFKPLTIILCFLVILGSGFLPVFWMIKDGAFLVFNILPLIAAWLLGFRLGILYWILHCSLLSFLSIMAGKTVDDFFSMGIFAYIIALVFVAGIGKMSDLTKRLQHELKERKRFEKGLQHYKEKLEKLVEDRTEELLRSNQMLKQEIIEKERANIEKRKLEDSLKRAEKMEAVGILAGGVAHDLNNILSGILSYPELILLDIPEDSPLRAPILTIQKSGEKAAAVVQDLLALARRGIINPQILNFNHILSDLLESPEFLKLAADYPDIELQTDLQPDLFNLHGSQVHLSKAIMNLIVNSMEAMKDGGQLIISTSNLSIDKPSGNYDALEKGEYVAVKVSDKGEGISEGDLSRVFEPFYTKKSMGRSGTGLGLAIVWGTVKDHKGHVDVQSVKGKGTTFSLYFPSTREEEFIRDSNLNFANYSGNGESILVIDDTELQRKLCTSMLERLNYSVNSVSSGEEAVEYMANHSLDLLILDMILEGGIDGYETYKKIIDIHPGQKAIISSGFTKSDRVKKTQELGAGTYVKKPYSIKELGMAVKNELHSPGSA